MLISKCLAVLFRLMHCAAKLVDPGPETAPETRINDNGHTFHTLKQITSQVMRYLLGRDRPEEMIYYGDYQAYGNVSLTLALETMSLAIIIPGRYTIATSINRYN